MGYFDRREELKKKAKEHTAKMAAQYEQEIKESIEHTRVYSDSVKEIGLRKAGDAPYTIFVDDMDSAKSLVKHMNGKTAVLNFASYKNPGGKFIEGSSAQEESLCHASTLYNILSAFPDYYDYNRSHNNRALYRNRALYSENVVFLDNSPCVYGADAQVVKADVITCAAPNYSAAGKYARISRDENNIVLKDRIKFVLDVAEANKVETLILGAFGCGVFGQDATTVASYFKECLEKYDYHFKSVYFSVLNVRGRNESNYEKFRAVFG